MTVNNQEQQPIKMPPPPPLRIPSIGRVVMYVPTIAEISMFQDQPPVMSAIVTKSSEDSTEICLKAFPNDDVPTFFRTSVPHSDVKKPGSWHWPEIK